MKNTKYLLLIASVLILMTGCVSDIEKEQDPIIGFESDLIQFILEDDQSKDEISTRSDSFTESDGHSVLYSEDGDSLIMRICTEDTLEPADLVCPETTKGVPVTDTNLAARFNGSQDATRIAVKSFLPGNLNTPYISDYLLYTGDSGNPWPAKEGPYYWPKVNDLLQFWAWAPKSINPTISASGLQFTYTTPAHTSDNIDAKNENELLASFTQANKDTYSGKAPLKMLHLLSAIKFQVGVTMAGTVNSISLVNIKNTGTCTLSTSNVVSWSNVSGTQTYTQSFNKSINENPSGNPVQSITADADGTLFMMVPQELGTQYISLEFVSEGGLTKTYTGEVPLGQSGKWEPGKTYTYTISNNGEVHVDITDVVSNNVKNNVVIKNTGTVREYIRAVIVGNWFDASHNIVSSWTYNTSNPSESGFEGLTSGESNDWIYNSQDGYYYYKYPVIPNKATGTPLFTKFTSGAAPVANSHFEMLISVQGVQWDSEKIKLKQAWASAPADKLSSDVKK